MMQKRVKLKSIGNYNAIFASHKHNNFLYQTCFDATSVIFSVRYFEIAVEFKSCAMLQSSLHCDRLAILRAEKFKTSNA